jgi:hypothetical protein
MLKIFKHNGKRLMLSAVCLTLLGCSTTVPLTRKFPQVPQVLMEPAPNLKQLPDNKKTLTDLLENANENYGIYFDVLERYKSWQEWYIQQKQIFESVK